MVRTLTLGGRATAGLERGMSGDLKLILGTGYSIPDFRKIGTVRTFGS